MWKAKLEWTLPCKEPNQEDDDSSLLQNGEIFVAERSVPSDLQFSDIVFLDKAIQAA